MVPLGMGCIAKTGCTASEVMYLSAMYKKTGKGGIWEEGRRKKISEKTELDKFPFPLFLPKRIEFTKNNFFLHTPKCNFFFKLFRSQKLNSTLFNDTFP